QHVTGREARGVVRVDHDLGDAPLGDQQLLPVAVDRLAADARAGALGERAAQLLALGVRAALQAVGRLVGEATGGIPQFLAVGGLQRAEVADALAVERVACATLRRVGGLGGVLQLDDVVEAEVRAVGAADHRADARLVDDAGGLVARAAARQ